MENSEILTFESDWLPPAELDRLISEGRPDIVGLSVSRASAPHRGLDPSVAVSLITGLVSIAVPFVTKLAERLFAKEPDALVILSDQDGHEQVVLKATMPPQVRGQLVEDALALGALRVRISIDSVSR